MSIPSAPTFLESESTFDVPFGVPQAFKFEGKKIYVRDCYPQYYDLLVSLLEDDGVERVSVTGTPGNGKSTFYLYFVTRYIEENPEKIIALASFTKSRKMMSCKTCKDGSLHSEANIPRNNVDLYLYDGPPEQQQPDDSGKLVVFTCPNFGWFNDIVRDSYHRTRYMPDWAFSELQKANIELELGISAQVLNERFRLFGGSARYCLSTNEEYVNKGRAKIRQGLSKITSLRHIESCFDGETDLDLVSNRLMRYVISDPTRLYHADLVPASEEISILMKERLDSDLQHERIKLMRWLEGSSKASTFACWLFENFVHEELQKGGTFIIRPLGSAERESDQLVIDKQQGVYQRFKEKIALDQIFRDIYHAPEASTLKSIDSLIVTPDLLVLFQITRNSSHPVASEGIVDLLMKLGKLQDAKANRISVQLIFVVPIQMSATYKSQPVMNKDVFGLSFENLRACDCGVVPGIARVKKRKLNDLGIYNVGQLVEADPMKISFVQNALDKLQADFAAMQELSFLNTMKQFVLGVDYSIQNVTV
mmetsp:Transcript_10240/g.28214  ORF Transcript_10240/g.28214 Transcript_10240/m.28214 type:complete len:536 (+) Transcript_10240:7-1614(+)